MDFKSLMTDFVYEELIFVAFDNSGWITSFGCRCYNNQLEAIRLYCQAKLQSNPNNAVGLITMGVVPPYSSCLAPTSDVDEIMTYLRRGINYGGDFNLDFITGFIRSMSWVSQCLFRAKQKRLLFCVGGPTNLSYDVAESYGYTAKKRGVAVDVVNFCPKEERLLEGFVVAADNYGNSHIKHIQPGCSLPVLREALSSFPPIITRELMEQGEIAAAAAAMKKKDKEKEDSIREMELLNRKGKNQAAAAAAYDAHAKARRKELLNKFNAPSRVLDDER